jgi:hypothetical protein
VKRGATRPFGMVIVQFIPNGGVRCLRAPGTVESY